MAKKPHLFERLDQEERLSLMRLSCHLVFGENKGEEMWKAMEPSLRYDERQFGDARDPDKNYWKGVWRIYEAD